LTIAIAEGKTPVLGTPVDCSETPDWMDMLSATCSIFAECRQRYDLYRVARLIAHYGLAEFLRPGMHVSSIDDWLPVLKLCQSPLEARLAVALLDRHIPYHASALTAQYHLELADRQVFIDLVVDSNTLLKATPPVRIGIEVDGHDFHERTKEQAANDRSRDRQLLLAGWTIIRFTGSEVWHDARACAQEVADLIDHLEQNCKLSSVTSEQAPHAL
jgi:hypothetical protein